MIEKPECPTQLMPKAAFGHDPGPLLTKVKLKISCMSAYTIMLTAVTVAQG
jgi:hypothetical protein